MSGFDLRFFDLYKNSTRRVFSYTTCNTFPSPASTAASAARSPDAVQWCSTLIAPTFEGKIQIRRQRVCVRWYEICRRTALHFLEKGGVIQSIVQNNSSYAM